MSTLLGIRLQMEPVRSLEAADIDVGYMGIGTSIQHPIRMIFVQNLTDETCMFSLDGINDNFPLPPNGFLLLDVTSNRSLSQGFFIAEGTRVYVKYVSGAPDMGSVYVSTMYANL